MSELPHASSTSLSEMFRKTLESLEAGLPVVTATGGEIRPEAVRESDGTSNIVWR
uniref:Glycosyltransferase family 4 protein n=1 Tax=Streptomyces sp. NBC_01393 TaxID=2903851 RepID=A0AAU3IC38_9ACTN